MAKTAYTMPPDAGSTNAGVTPSIGNCGRGIQRTGDIRHTGDNIVFQKGTGTPLTQTVTLTPGTDQHAIVSSVLDNDQPGANPNGYDSASAPQAFSGSYGGLDASSEGADGYGSRQGGRS